MKRVEGIKNVDILNIGTQGIVGVGATTLLSIVSSRPAACRRITNVGFTHGTLSSSL
jgi:hypothetical protein